MAVTGFRAGGQCQGGERAARIQPRRSMAHGTEPHAGSPMGAHTLSSSLAGLGEPASPRTYLCEAKRKGKTKSFTVQNSSIDFFKLSRALF